MTLNRKQKRNIYIAFRLTASVLKVLYIVAMIGFFAWIGWSFIEVQIHNFTMLSDNPYQYSSINFFGLMSAWAGR